MSEKNCPNCNKSLVGFLSADPLDQQKVDFINRFSDNNREGYCSSCSKPILKEIANKFNAEKQEIEKRIKKIINHIPVMTCPAPINWSYEVLGMVSTQTTAGTGFATELSQSFNDFFGNGSTKTNNKIKNATSVCRADLRLNCIRGGGNAIISTDIDFNEIGAGNTNMLMVCMAGTAIRVTDANNFNEKSRDQIAEVVELVEKLSAIDEMNK